MKEDITVILPVYNGGRYLRDSVESVIKQNHLNFQFIILDDCSTDGSWEYLKSLINPKIKLFRNSENKGLFFNLNWLIKESSAPLIKLWAQDDIMYPNCLESFVDFFNKYPHTGFCYSGRDMIDEQGKIKENYKVDNTPTIISSALHAKIAYYTGSIAGNIANVCINKKALVEVGLFNEQMKISADFEMWVRLAKVHETGFIREKLIQLRDHDKQLSRNEKYYINHVREDLETYRYLDSYVTPEQKKEGRKLMRSHKLIFYYTLMIKSFVKLNFSTFLKYFSCLVHYDNFMLLSFAFMKSKLLGKKHELDISKEF